ncbi:hypothetical protein [Flavobacterium degerlachei]|uniref:hypothetical protein n=1 Tax=Flavobacterium degerlachei TaxID=229203 RepID=UPI000B821264|nr:hypothetical protein [Flavobacterium degerlachei]
MAKQNINGLSNATHLKKLNLLWHNLKEINIHNETIEVLQMCQKHLESTDTNGALNLKNILLL